MPRPIWSGSISFGLVNVPVRLFPAVREHRLRFHLVHEPDGGAIGYQKVCKAEGRPVPDDQVVKAFEIRKGEYVPMSDEDFEAACAEFLPADIAEGLNGLPLDAAIKVATALPFNRAVQVFDEPQLQRRGEERLVVT